MVLSKEEDIDGKEETHSRRDRDEASAGRRADGPRQAGERGNPDDLGDGSNVLPVVCIGNYIRA